MAGYVSTEQYLWGLRRVLDGITARVTPDGPTPAKLPGRSGPRAVHSA